MSFEAIAGCEIISESDRFEEQGATVIVYRRAGTEEEGARNRKLLEEAIEIALMRLYS